MEIESNENILCVDVDDTLVMWFWPKEREDEVMEFNNHDICKDLGYKVDHFFLVRTKGYNPAGRNQDEATAIEYDTKIRAFLDEYPVNYKIIMCDESAEDNIIKELLKQDKE